MKVGLGSGYWGAGPPEGTAEQIVEADRLGFDSFWTSEAYGSDALTPLAWWGARTEQIRLGTAICQMSARTPTALAMAAITLDHLSAGRAIIGIGASGPQVVEGWYGQPYPRPLARTREYIEVMRQVFARERVEFDGEFFQLPAHGGAGLGKALKSTVHPLREDIPIFLGAEGPKNVALAAEIADGWLPLWFSPKLDEFYRDALTAGFATKAARRTVDSFEVSSTIWVIDHDDVEVAASFIKPVLALYIGGMGAKGANFHQDVFVRMGWEDVCKEVEHLYLAGEKEQAASAIPLELVEDVALVGPVDKICEEIEGKWKQTCLTTMILGGWPAADTRNRIVESILR
ncbi:MAG: LLM class F420-dependent oxidoreductase [Acidimicrobiales bacterium]